MRKNIITLTKEALDLCATIKVREMELPSEIAGGTVIAGIEKTSVYGGSDLLEDVSMAIGCYELRDKDSDESPNGILFDEDLENKMYTLHEFVMDNLVNIETLIHYWSNKGGLTPGTYDTITLQKID